jgi:hypothetical protein
MDQRHSETITLPLLPIAALLALCFTLLLPLHTAHAAPQRPLTSCLNTDFFDSFSLPMGVSNIFYSDQVFSCDKYLYMIDTTTISVSSGNLASIDAQTDTWLDQINHNCGGCDTRYGETGRSSRASYPANGNWYTIQTASLYNLWLVSLWGCNWINWYNLGSVDYNCGDIV